MTAAKQRRSQVKQFINGGIIILKQVNSYSDDCEERYQEQNENVQNYI
jgi:hypothetical protein